jgi:hypothetical protein
MKITSIKITTVIKTAVFYALSLLLPFIGTLSFFSCNQDDIFYQIEYETALRDPLIKGGPSKIVEFEDALYVASGGIWTYSQSGGWRGISGPPGIKVLDIAVTKNGNEEYLYAVTSSGVSLGDSGYYRGTKDNDSDEIAWERIENPSYPYPTAIYSAGDALFAGTASGSNYAVYALKGDEMKFTPIKSSDSQGSGRLLGAAKLDNTYFFSLDGQGVFTWNDSAGTFDGPIEGSADTVNENGETVPAVVGNITGFIEVDGSLLMVSTSGVICKLSNSGTITEEDSRSLGFTFTGALAVWNDREAEAAAAPGEEPDYSKRLLLLGRKGSNVNYSGYGYYECPILPGFKIGELGIMEPQLTVEKNATYKNSLGKRAINSIIQAPYNIDSSMPIFASTQAYNLWACRDGVWNYE